MPIDPLYNAACRLAERLQVPYARCVLALREIESGCRTLGLQPGADGYCLDWVDDPGTKCLTIRLHANLAQMVAEHKALRQELRELRQELRLARQGYREALGEMALDELLVQQRLNELQMKGV